MRRHWPRIPMPTSSECGGVRTTEPPTWRTVGAHAYERAEDMFADVDAVAFAVRRTFRRSSRSGPRPRGCHLLMDKPVAFTSQDAERVVEAVDRAGVRSLVFLTSRFELRLRPHVRLDLRAGQSLRSLTVAPFMRGPVGHRPTRTVHPGTGTGTRDARHRRSWPRRHGDDRSASRIRSCQHHVAQPDRPARQPRRHLAALRSGSPGLYARSHHHPKGSDGSMHLSAAQATQPGRWHHPCDVRFGRDVVKILQGADLFLRRPLDSRGQRVG